jgi:polysaccharide export outer membrane protein
MVVFFSSCIPHREILYLQDKESDMEFNQLSQITGKYILQSNDYLYIQVSTFDPRISEFFNAAQKSSSGSSGEDSNFSMYLIDDDMNIDFPYAGKINLAGCNIANAKEKIKKDLEPFVKDANIMVRLGSNHFTILGEVRSPGQKRMHKDQITIFEAIGMAGDLTVFGKKREIQIVRPIAMGISKTFTVDITDKKLINSEYYYVYPNDLIYIRPMRAKQFGLGESFSIGVLSSLLAFALTIFTLTK